MFKSTFLFSAAVLALATMQPAPAQSTEPTYQSMFEWGGIHLQPGQAIVLNFTIGDEAGQFSLPLELELEGKNGNVVFKTSLVVSSGHTYSFAVAPEIRAAVGPEIRTVIPGADIYAIIDPNFRTLAPCLKITFPPGPSQPILDQITPTLEVIDLLTGRLVNFSNNPHAIIGVLRQ